jgi:FeS assembly SUF system protein
MMSPDTDPFAFDRDDKPAATPPEPAAAEGGAPATLETQVLDSLRAVFDPEIPVNIVELGLIYDVRIDPESKNVEIDMTLTAPNCPVAGTLPGEVERTAAAVPGLGTVKANLVFTPPWNPTFMSEEARLELGMF